MSMHTYLERYAFKDRFLTSAPPDPRLRQVVVIPSYGEHLLPTAIQSLLNCNAPESPTEVIAVINAPKGVADEVAQANEMSLASVQEMARSFTTRNVTVHTIHASSLPARHHGVGLARKIGMDEAARRFAVNNSDGIMVCFDADCTCDPNYLREIESYYGRNPETVGASIYFEHDLESVDGRQRVGIAQYELHLRYLRNALQFAGFPFAHYTVGSAMTVMASVYAKQGGMNRRKAGEDFHFLNRTMQHGPFGTITGTTVYPSPRSSDRVPFGTGRSMTQWMHSEDTDLLTYAPDAYVALKEFFAIAPHFWKSKDNPMSVEIPVAIRDFLQNEGGEEEILRIVQSTRSPEAFTTRFFQYFDGFRVVKFLNYSARSHHHKIPIRDAGHWLLGRIYDADQIPTEVVDQLLLFRRLDKRSG